jgi:hypothetical protein
VTDLLVQLKDVCRSGDGRTARCPAHPDRHNSLTVHDREGCWLLKCHAGCGWQEIINALGIDGVLLSPIGLVGERRAAKLICLALTSRLADRLVAVVVKGPSSGGKSFVVESTLKFFPPPAFYSLTAMSDRALAYSCEPLRYRLKKVPLDDDR